MTFDKHRSAGYLANHMARLFAQRLAEAIRPLGLAPAQFMTLIELWRRDGLTQRELVGLLDIEQATLANTLARMERDDLIVRRSVAGDARARTIHVTPKARALEGPATEAARAVNGHALAGLDPARAEAFLGDMQTVIAALKEKPE